MPEHLAEVKARKLDLIAKTEAAVKDRLTKEITYWDHRAEELKLQESDDFILAVVEFLDDDAHRVHYVRRPFRREPDFGVTSVNYALAELIAQSDTPS